MSDDNDLDYYRERERTARRQAAEATDPAIAAIHTDMAKRYAALIAEQSDKEVRPRPSLKLKL